MTHAEQLRKHAELAMREGGMYYSGEYLSGMAKAAESLEAENAKLRELVRALAYCANDMADCDKCLINGSFYGPVEQAYCDEMAEKLRDLGIEVE